MNTSVKNELLEFHQKNRITWFAILAGMLTLVILVVVFHTMDLFRAPLTSKLGMYNQLFLFVVFALAFLIIILKRIFFAPSQLVSAARRKAHRQKVEDDAEGRRQILRFALQRIRVFSLILWVLADLIVLVGFFSYLFLLSLQSFMIYAIVGLYSLAINYPRTGLLESCYEQIMPGDEEH